MEAFTYIKVKEISWDSCSDFFMYKNDVLLVASYYIEVAIDSSYETEISVPLSRLPDNQRQILKRDVATKKSFDHKGQQMLPTCGQQRKKVHY